ncbi:MAG: glycine cleavage system aminomethyltransferase GcvT [Proteobacteria bacterium]|nr:glycine cleavage system aminomethyltransferase GcvT [Pseudomonadota bacterium]
MDTSLKKSPLWNEHQKLGARFVPFSGYDMPVQYQGVLVEHQAVREKAGLFDVSHMGVSIFSGPNILEKINTIITRDVSQLAVGKGAYTLLCRDNGYCVDDLILYRIENEKILFVFNASNKEKDFEYIQSKLKGNDFKATPPSEDWALIALQGPSSVKILKDLGLKSWPETFSVIEHSISGISCTLLFTGYTGELGCEICVKSQDAAKLWNELLKSGKNEGLIACGLGARDTLRLEMGYSLYGHEISEEINPLEAGLSWAVNFSKENFIGKEALLTYKNSPKRKLIALKNNSKQAPRGEMRVYDATGREVGFITSGSLAPSLGHAIGLALVSTDSNAPYSVGIRDKKIPFDLTKRPFYKKLNKET